MPAPSPGTESNNLVSYTILTGGKEINSAFQVRSIEINRAINRIPTARFTISDGDPSTQTFAISDKPDFAPGKTVEIKLGYGTDEKTAFKGIILQHGIKSKNCEAPELVVECKDEAVKMTIGRKNGYFGDGKTSVTDTQVIQDVIKDSGLKATVGSSSVKYPEVVQYYSTNWDFMLTRAEISSMIVVVDDGTVKVNEPSVSGSAVLSLTYGTDILDFSADMDAETQLESVQSAAWDMGTQKVITAKGDKPKVNKQGDSATDSSKLASVLGIKDYNLQTSAELDQNGLKAWASAQMQRSWLSRIRGKVKFAGSTLAKPDTLMDLEGVGKNFDGSIYVTSIKHEVSNGKWTTTAEFGLSARWFSETPNVVAPTASGQLPGIQGLQSGKVEKIYEDPGKESRIQVSIPILQDQTKKIWARMATFYATSSAGAVFYPEVGDEVILGFVNDDPRYPVILGSLYSSKIKTPYPANKDNSPKAIKTKAGNQIIFNDKDKVITITTPGGNTIVFTDKNKKVTITDQNKNVIDMTTSGITVTDKNKNKMTMASSGITLSSMKDIKLSAKGKVSINGPLGVSLDSNADVALKGLNIKQTANMQFTAKGNMKAELSSGLSTAVKGLSVMIN